MNSSQPDSINFESLETPETPNSGTVRQLFPKSSEKAESAPSLQLIRGLKPIHGARRGPSIPTQILIEFLPHWLADAEYLNQSPRTIEGKKDAGEKLLWFLEREKKDLCGIVEIQAFLLHVRNGWKEPNGRFGARHAHSYQPVGERSLQLRFVYLRGFFDWLVETDLVEANPLSGQKQPKVAKKQIQPLTEEDVLKLLATAATGVHSLRNEAVLYLLLDTGIRVSELCSIRVRQLDLAKRTVTVTGKGNKSREVWFHPETARRIKQYLVKSKREPNSTLFYSERPSVEGDGLTRSGVLQMISDLGDRAGIRDKRVSPHTLRHTFATWFIRDGGQPKTLQMILGHEDMTMSYRYVTPAENDAAQQHRQHSPVGRLIENRKNAGN